MGFEGTERPHPSPREAKADLEDAVRRLEALTERYRNARVELDAQYPDPEIIYEDMDTVTLRVPGARRPVTFGLNFDDTRDRTANENHTEFLASEMDEAALQRYGGIVRLTLPHDLYEEWRATNTSADDPESNSEPYGEKKGDNDTTLEDRYGIPWGQGGKLYRVAMRHLLNGYRTRAGKQPLTKAHKTYEHNFPSISADAPAASLIIEETRSDPAPQNLSSDRKWPKF